MAAELGKVRLGNLTGTLILRMDDGSEVEVGSLSVPVDAMVSVTMPASVPAPDPREPFCEHCEGPHDAGWLVDGYGGHWDTCPEGVRINEAQKTEAVPEPERPLRVGTKVRVIDDGETVTELAGRVGIVIDPTIRGDLGVDQVLVHIPTYESLREDRSWSFRTDRLAVIG